MILFSEPCKLSQWSSWSECPSCRHSDHRPPTTRSRKIIEKAKYGGECPTNLDDTEACNIPRCPGNLTLIEAQYKEKIVE